MDQQHQAHEQPRRPHGPRLYHKKSRTGCFRCKERRVKCDEKRPACGGCSRHMVECVYPPPTDVTNGHHDGPHPRRQARRPPSSKGPRSGIAGRSLVSEPLVSPDGAVVDYPPAARITPQDSYTPPPLPWSNPVHIQQDTSLRLPPIITPSEPPDLPHPPSNDEILDPPESRTRRLTELQLLHHYIISQAQTFKRNIDPTEPSEGQRPDTFLWSVEALEMAFESDGILYALLAHSALCKWTKVVAASPSPDDDPAALRWRNLQRRYLAMALREQRRAVADLSIATANHVCMSSLTILGHSFALVQTSPTSPRWQPPLEWLRMGHGAGRVLQIAKSHMVLGRMARFLDTRPRFDADDIFSPAQRAPLMWLLDEPFPSPSSSSSSSSHPVKPDPGIATPSPSLAGDELLDPETERVYHRVLCYIGWCERAVAAHSESACDEPLFSVCRRFGAFAVWIPEAYHVFLADRRPRALVALAYFFSLWIPFREVWLIGSAGVDQLRAIQAELPPGWRAKLDGVAARYDVV